MLHSQSTGGQAGYTHRDWALKNNPRGLLSLDRRSLREGRIAVYEVIKAIDKQPSRKYCNTRMRWPHDDTSER